MIVETKYSLKKNTIGHFKIKNYKFERMENFKHLGVTLNDDNNEQTDLREGIKNAKKNHILGCENFFKIKSYQRNNN